MKEYIYIYENEIIYTSDRIENLTDLVRYATEKLKKQMNESKIKYYRHF